MVAYPRRLVKGRRFYLFPSFKEQGKGPHLGLATVYGIAKQSGSDIAVDNQPEQGVAFTLYLPVREADFANSTTARAGSPVWVGDHPAGS